MNSESDSCLVSAFIRRLLYSVVGQQSKAFVLISVLTVKL